MKKQVIIYSISVYSIKHFFENSWSGFVVQRRIYISLLRKLLFSRAYKVYTGIQKHISVYCLVVNKLKSVFNYGQGVKREYAWEAFRKESTLPS